METEYLRQRQLAARLKVSVQSIHNWHKEGLPFITRGSRFVLYELTEVLDWLRKRPGQTKTYVNGREFDGSTTKDRA